MDLISSSKRFLGSIKGNLKKGNLCKNSVSFYKIIYFLV
jgi:hypothetical protein